MTKLVTTENIAAEVIENTGSIYTHGPILTRRNSPTRKLARDARKKTLKL